MNLLNNQYTSYYKYNKIDTSKFKVALSTAIYGDSALQLTVIQDSTYIYTYLGFHKGVMPLTMYWYDSLFYSDGLPFPDLDPAPRAKGAYMCSDAVPSGNCNPDVWYIMCDTFNFMDNISPFKYSDSVVFVGTSGEITVGGFLLQIVDWNAVLVGIVPDKSPEEKFFIYPNPFHTSATLLLTNSFMTTNNKGKIEFTLYDLMGRKVKRFEISQPVIQINRNELSDGMYIYKINNGNKIISYGKIIIQ